MSAFDYDSLRAHIGHKIECVCYGKKGQDPHNVALECVDCGEVLTDFNHPDVASPPMKHLRAKYKKDHEYHFVGDIKHPGVIAVKAKSFDEALTRIDEYDFRVFDEEDKNLAFDWNGDEDMVRVK